MTNRNRIFIQLFLSYFHVGFFPSASETFNKAIHTKSEDENVNMQMYLVFFQVKFPSLYDYTKVVPSNKYVL